MSMINVAFTKRWFDADTMVPLGPEGKAPDEWCDWIDFACGFDGEVLGIRNWQEFQKTISLTPSATLMRIEDWKAEHGEE